MFKHQTVRFPAEAESKVTYFLNLETIRYTLIAKYNFIHQRRVFLDNAASRIKIHAYYARSTEMSRK
jgi:hypothetical protein